jgi:hypothetical protein
MFMHAGARPLWPVIVFLPWFLLGFGYLLESLLHHLQGRTATHRVPRKKPAGGVQRGT